MKKINIIFFLNYDKSVALCIIFASTGSCLKKGQQSIFFLIIHLFLPIKYSILFRIKDTVSDILSVLLNFIANYDCKNENIPPYCL